MGGVLELTLRTGMHSATCDLRSHLTHFCQQLFCPAWRLVSNVALPCL